MGDDSDDDRFDRFIEGLRTADDAILGDFVAQYRPALERLANRRIDPALQRRVGPESVAQSVCRTFLRRAEAGQFDLADGDALWRLLCAITLTKVCEKVRYHRRLKRAVDREHPLDSSAGMSDASRDEPDPSDAAAFAETLELALADFSQEERQILELRLLDKSLVEIAETLSVSKRTVQRRLKEMEARLTAALADDAA